MPRVMKRLTLPYIFTVHQYCIIPTPFELLTFAVALIGGFTLTRQETHQEMR